VFSKSEKVSIEKEKVDYDFSEYKLKIIEKDKSFKTFKIGKYKIECFNPDQYEIVECNDINDPYVLKPISIRGKIKTAQFTGKFYEENLRPLFEKEKAYNYLYKVYDMGDDGLGFRYIKNPNKKTINAVYYQGVPLKIRKENLNNAQKEVSYFDFYDFEIDMNNESKIIRNMGLISIQSIKPVNFIKFLISMIGKNDFFILDFFAGSGTTAHAVMKLNKEDGGKRKFILVEIGDYFDTVIIPRVKKVAYSFNWRDGKPQDSDGIGVFFKYQILEQYEDTLENIELQENQSVKKQSKDQYLQKFEDQYLQKYFLDYETRESPYLLNIDHLRNPFVYKLKVNLEEVGAPQEMVVDIPETFNYLLGLKIKKIKTRENGRKYLFILGEKEGKDYAIVWREYNDKWSDEDLKKDKEFIIQELEDWTPHVVYINGQSALTPKNFEIRLIEPEFTRLMGGFSDN